jgi:ATP-dependent RNA helicase DeaD
MLDMGFQEEVDTILETTPKEKYTLLFSATMPAQVERILAKYMTKPVIKSIGKKNTGTANVKHMYYLVHARDRYQALKRIADFNPSIYAIIFCRTRIETQEIADSLIRDGYNADSLHGDLSQAQRDYVMGRFRKRSLQMLVATDVAARGLDVNDLTHVINYNLPDDSEVYIHRSGRTGRADKLGICISIINLKEKFKIRQIEKMIGREFAQAKVPTGVQVCEKQLFHYTDRMENVVLDEEIESFLPVINRKLDWMTKEDLIKRFVSLEFNRFLEYYRDAKDLNVIEEERRSRDTESRERGRDSKRDGGRETRGSRGEGGRETRGSRGERSGDDRDLTRLFVSVGRKDRILPQQIIGLINEVTRSREIKVGRIDIMDSYSFVDIDSKAVPKVLKAFNDSSSNPDGVRIEVASERDGGDSSFKKRSPARGERTSRNDRFDKPDRAPRSDRSDSSERTSKDKPAWPFKGSDKPERTERSFDRSDRSSDRPERSSSDRSERSERSSSDRPDRKKKIQRDQSSFDSPWNRAPKRGDSGKSDSRRSDSRKGDSRRGKR